MSHRSADKSTRRLGGWDLPLDPVLRRLLPAARRGPLLYVGLPGAKCPEWLAQAGFEPELVALGESPVGAGHPPPPLGQTGPRFALAILDGVMSYLAPRDGDALLARAKSLTIPVGILYVAAYDVDDAAADRAHNVRKSAIELGQGSDPAAFPVRFFHIGELAMALEGWLVLHATHGAPMSREGPGQGTDGPLSEGGQGRSISVVAARRPSGGALLV